MPENPSYQELSLEQALIDKMKDFLLELGRGFSFVARQMRLAFDNKHYYIDLVFFNYVLNCFVLVELKAGALTPRDVGQMDFYLRAFEDTCAQPNNNPTVGIILCADRDEHIARYTTLADNENLYSARYKTYLPSEEELRRELERGRQAIEESLLGNPHIVRLAESSEVPLLAE